MIHKTRAIALHILALFMSIFMFMSLTTQAVGAAAPVVGKIVFIANQHVWISNADGSSAVQITSDDASYSSPSLSPDATRVAVERRVGNANSRIFIMKTDGTETLQLSASYIDYTGLGDVYPYIGSQFRPKWHPDGSRVAFYSQEFAQEGSDPYRVYDAPIGGQGVEYRNGMNPEYSPDGSSLAFQVYDQVGIDYYWRIKKVTFSSNVITELYRTTSELSEYSWSPLNDKLVLQEAISNVASQLTIIETSKDYSTQIPLIVTDSLYVMLANPEWSHDGSKIALVGAREESTTKDLLVYELSGDAFVVAQEANVVGASYSMPLWDVTDRLILANFVNGVDAPITLAVIDTANLSRSLLVGTDDAPSALRDVKDWSATFQAPSRPQVLGASTSDLPPKKSITSGAVLGATTLPATGVGQSTPNAALVMIIIGSVLVFLSRSYGK